MMTAKIYMTVYPSHHLLSLSSIGREYKDNPVTGLIPYVQIDTPSFTGEWN
ncbi:hypothetical protein [Pseudomonas fluorescens]|uniref:hypothetical protein n=1 Tax=Pseudomonas fluorescens TaxID=294 RepID=UPI0015EB6CDB|nr:hypothetical protein [Pseudomonas fluorescens]